MVRTPGWVAVSAGAYLVALSLLVLYLDGVALTGPLTLVVVAGSAGLVALTSRLHPRPVIALADRRLHVVLATVPIGVVVVAVYLPGVATVSPADPTNWLLVCWIITGVALYSSVTNTQARHYEERSERVIHLRVRPASRMRKRRTAVFGVLGVVLVAIGITLVISTSSATSSLVMGLGFTALFSGVFSARRARTYRLLDTGVVRQDSGALVGTFVPRSRIKVAERDGEVIRFERRGPWYPPTTLVVDEGGNREATARWFDVGTGSPY